MFTRKHHSHKTVAVLAASSLLVACTGTEDNRSSSVTSSVSSQSSSVTVSSVSSSSVNSSPVSSAPAQSSMPASTAGSSSLNSHSSQNTVNAFTLREAEDYNADNSIMLVDGGEAVGYFDTGSFLAYNNIQFGTVPALSIELDIAKKESGGEIEVRLDAPDGEVACRLSPTTTGSWTEYTPQRASCLPTTGEHTIYLVGASGMGIANINAFQFLTAAYEPPACNTQNSALFNNGIEYSAFSQNLINEASGIAPSGHSESTVWVHNDSGGLNRVHAVGINGENVGMLYLQGATAIDWEDMAAGPGPIDGETYLYVGDIGDNNAVRDIKTIYRFIEPNINALGAPFNETVTQVDALRYRYPGGARDAEALMVDPNTKDYYIISKRESQVRIYVSRYPQPVNEVTTLEYLGAIALTSITAGDISPNGNEILLKDYGSIYYWQRRPEESIAQALLRPALQVPYNIAEPQGEAISFTASAKGYYTVSEESGNGYRAHLAYYAQQCQQ